MLVRCETARTFTGEPVRGRGGRRSRNVGAAAPLAAPVQLMSIGVPMATSSGWSGKSTPSMPEESRRPRCQNRRRRVAALEPRRGRRVDAGRFRADVLWPRAARYAHRPADQDDVALPT